MSIPMSYASGKPEWPLLEETIGENFARTVKEHGRRQALVVTHQNYRATYNELWSVVEQCARGLMSRGVKKGDRVGIWSPNRYEWVVVQYATARIGAILVNVNPAYQKKELEYALWQSGISVLIAASGFRDVDYIEMIDEIRGACVELREVIIIERDWNDLLAEAAKIPVENLEKIESTLKPGEPINIQYTSGTTGLPKGATLSHKNILNNGYAVGKICRYSELDKICIPVPFYHCFGMVLGNLAATTHGASMIIPAEAFDPLETLKVVQAEKCTSLYGVPTMFISEVEHPEFKKFDLSSLRTGIMAGATCPVELMKRVTTEMGMEEITIGYGMTETSPISTQTRPDDEFELRVSTVGRVHPHIEIKIINPETGETVPCGEPGEFCTRGYSVMLGYWGDKEATDKSIDAEGWMHSGDLATMDENGYAKIVGRIKDMIIRGGENISPREIEEFLFTNPHIADVQVIGVPSEKYGEEVMAWVMLHEGESVSEQELKEWCSGNISSFKIPKYWKFVSEFPMTVTGKIQKYKLREMAKSDLAGAGQTQ